MRGMSVILPVNESKRELHPLLIVALRSDLARAVKASLASMIVVCGASVVFSLPTEIMFRVAAGCVMLFFALVFIADIWHLLAKNVKGIAAIIQARAEIITGQDLNQSGAVGDVITLEPETKEVIRLVPTNQHQKVIHTPSGIELPVADFVEFVRALETRGIERAKWISESKSKPFAYKFTSGRIMDRPTYDAMCEVLEKRARVLHGRVRGTSGTLTAKPDEILNRLGLE